MSASKQEAEELVKKILQFDKTSSHYDILGITENCSSIDVEQAFLYKYIAITTVLQKIEDAKIKANAEKAFLILDKAFHSLKGYKIEKKPT
jgi:preprotein translocase subunit Sec63